MTWLAVAGHRTLWYGPEPVGGTPDRRRPLESLGRVRLESENGRLQTRSNESSIGAAPLLDVRDLKKHFPVTRGFLLQREIGRVKAVDGVSFHIARGETLGLVGESGCGKTTIGRCILKLMDPTDGSIVFDGEDVTSLDRQGMRAFRRRVQAIFQDPYSSLNPRMKVHEIVGEPLWIHGEERNGAALARRVAELLEVCGLPRQLADRYPHEMSGGQRQRVGIARALALKPDFIVCDEAVSALDVSIQAQIINLLEDLRDEFGLTYLFIGHDLSVVRHLCHRVAVMYLGRLVELADADTVFDSPLHPYTRALLAAVPVPDPAIEKRRPHEVLAGEVPSPMNPPRGCVFHPRCSHAIDSCRAETPALTEPHPGHVVACPVVAAKA
ncbi:MAG: ABC transporter ATP-binding protein [Ectothiorhodospiraceae bacterium]|nr:ABC transporter ATP-binding protein [Chromatiales bacterium]MCP5156002.1 ABC transporter ATP-binding protein [Ectothiorhodospiraceae bacterium]